MATFNGVNLFGVAVVMNRVSNPAARQENAYPGLSGVESLTMGLRGRFTIVTGRLYGATVADLNVAEITFESYVDGAAYILVDDYLNTWTNVVLESFEPDGRVQADPHLGYSRRYKARFRHLT